MKLPKLKFLLVGFIVALLWMGDCCYPVYAQTSVLLDRSRFQVQDLSSSRKVEAPINLKELGIEYWHQIPDKMPTEKQLLQLSVKLRNIARDLSSSWLVKLPIYNNQTGEIDEHKNEHPRFEITDFKKTDNTWTTMTVGYALKLVAQELDVLKQSGEQPLLDFLVRDEITNRYRPLINIPLARYCYELVKLFSV
jgi:hypothetical protein